VGFDRINVWQLVLWGLCLSALCLAHCANLHALALGSQRARADRMLSSLAGSPWWTFLGAAQQGQSSPCAHGCEVLFHARFDSTVSLLLVLCCSLLQT
jgi:hypothetical protein